MAKTQTPEKPASDEVAAQLKALAGELAQVADDEAARATTLKKLEDFLGSLRVADFPDLAESPVVQNFVKLMGGDLKPGETRKAGTLAERSRDWTFRDLEQFDKVTFTPRETLPLTWNGLTIYVQDDVEATVPKPFYDIYVEHRRAIDQARRHEDYLLGYSHVPPDPNWLAEGSATVRAWSQMGPAPDARKRGVGPFPMDEPAEEAANG